MISIKIDKSEKCNGEYSLYVSFPYDPIIVTKIKEQSIRYYNPNTREWELPVKSLDKLKEALKDYELNIVNSNEDCFKTLLSNKTINYIPKDYKFKIQPFKHQIEGVNYGLKYDRFLLRR